jgi:hypothetical protein
MARYDLHRPNGAGRLVPDKSYDLDGWAGETGAVEAVRLYLDQTLTHRTELQDFQKRGYVVVEHLTDHAGVPTRLHRVAYLGVRRTVALVIEGHGEGA